MNIENYGRIFNTGTALAIGLILSSLILGYSYQSKKDSDESVQVTGAATKRIVSDLVTWTAGLSYNASELSTAYGRLSTNIPAVKEYLIENGMTEDEITVSAISSSTQYRKDGNGNSTNELMGYTLSQRIQVRSNKVKVVAKIARESTKLINKGILIESESPEYFFTKLGELKIEMLGEAAKNARIRADQIASNTGSSVGTIRSARMGVMQITAADSTDVSDYGINDTSTIDKDVTAVVKATFAVN
jgi:hypothetical protein